MDLLHREMTRKEGSIGWQPSSDPHLPALNRATAAARAVVIALSVEVDSALAVPSTQRPTYNDEGGIHDVDGYLETTLQVVAAALLSFSRGGL